MRVRRRDVVLLGCAALSAALIPGVGVAPARAETVTKVLGITMAIKDATLVGGQLTTLTVRVHLFDPDGVRSAL